MILYEMSLKLMMPQTKSFIELNKIYSVITFEIDNTYFISLTNIEDTVDDGIHARVGAREEEKSSLNAFVDFEG